MTFVIWWHKNAWTINFTDITIDEIVPDIEVSCKEKKKTEPISLYFVFCLGYENKNNTVAHSKKTKN